MIRRCGWRVWLAILIAAVPQALLAQPAPESLQLEPITILGTRTQKAPDEVPRSIDVIELDRITHMQNAELGAIVEVLPNVGLTGGPGLVSGQITIRGLSGQRVLLLIDGIRQDFSIGHMGNGFIAPALIESVEVERGPASVMWGSGAIGGVVSVDTKDAADLLAEGRDVGALLHAGYQSATNGWITNGAVYGHLGDSVDALVLIGRASHEELELGNGESLAESDYRRNSLLAKGTLHIAPGHSLQLSHRRLRLRIPESPAENRDIDINASRVEWNYLPATSKLVDLTVGLSHIRTDADEVQPDTNSPTTVLKSTLVTGFGLDIVNTSRMDMGVAGRHVLTYGFNANRKQIEATTTDTNPRLVASGKRRVAGVFVQDEIHWNAAWTTTFGLRYDRYHSEADGGSGLEHDDSELSLQAGLLWQATDWLQLYASYAEAFRAPSVSELFTDSLHPPPAKFRIKPNPDLQPEKAANKELGVRMHWRGVFAKRDRLRFEATAFRNDVENFIDTVCVTPNCGRAFAPGPPLPVFQNVNVTQARLEGFEARLSYATDAWFVAMNYGQTRGYNETEDQPLASIPADTWVVRAGVTALPWNGRITWRMTHADTQDRVPPGTQPTDSYTTHDLLTSWHPTPNLRLNFAITNITDRDYRLHPAVTPEAGRNFKFGLTLKF